MLVTEWYRIAESI